MGLVGSAPTAFTITLNSKANNSTQSSASVDNTTNGYGRAIVSVQLKSGGTAPTEDAVAFVYLLRDDNDSTDPIRTDNWDGTNSSSFVRENAPILGTIVFTATANKEFVGEFDTGPFGPLGPKWGIAVENQSGQALNSADNIARFRYVTSE